MEISAERPCGAKNKKKCDRDFPTMNNITIDTRNYLGDILLDLMRIAMDGDQQEFDNDKFGEHVAAEIWHCKKPWATLNSLKVKIVQHNNETITNELCHLDLDIENEKFPGSWKWKKNTDENILLQMKFQDIGK